jgi:hypothetical protein
VWRSRREIYRKVFETFNGVEIERTIERLFFEAIFGEYPRSKVEVPDHLLLWIILLAAESGEDAKATYRQETKILKSRDSKTVYANYTKSVGCRSERLKSKRLKRFPNRRLFPSRAC